MTCFRRRKWCSTCGGVRAHARRVETRFEARAGNVLLEYLAVARRDARPARRLPDVEPYDYLRPSRWCHGGILQSSGRSEALPAIPTLPGRGACAQQFPISRSKRRAPPVATPPGPSSGQGQTAIRRRSIGGPSGFARIVGNAPNTRHRSSSVAYLGMQWVSMHLSERAISLQLEWPPFALRGRFCVENASVFGTGSKLMNAPCPATAIVLVV